MPEPSEIPDGFYTSLAKECDRLISGLIEPHLEAGTLNKARLKLAEEEIGLNLNLSADASPIFHDALISLTKMESSTLKIFQSYDTGQGI